MGIGKLISLLGAANQAGLIRALHATMDPEEYRKLIDEARSICGEKGIDRVLEDNDVDIILGPGDGPMFVIAGTAGKWPNTLQMFF